MPITINGSGTVTGISTGGLPDGVVDEDTLASNSVSNAKMKDDAVGTAELADDAVDSARIANNAIGLAELAGIARGKIIYGDSSGDPAVLTAGSNGQVLTSDGTDISWADAGGGEIKQLKWEYQADAHTGNSSYQDTGFEISMTNSSASSRNIIFLTGELRNEMGYGNPPPRLYLELQKDGTSVRTYNYWHTNLSHDNTLNEDGGNGYDWERRTALTCIHRDHPNDTNSHDWKFRFKEVATTHYGLIDLNHCILFVLEVGNGGN